MKTKSGTIWRVAVVVAMVLAMVPVLMATPVLAATLGTTADADLGILAVSDGEQLAVQKVTLDNMAGAGDIEIDSFAVSIGAGTMDDADVTEVAVYRDTNGEAGVWDGGDTEIGTAVDFAGADAIGDDGDAVCLTIAAGTTETVFVVITLDAAPVDGHSLKTTLDATDLVSTSPDGWDTDEGIEMATSFTYVGVGPEGWGAPENCMPGESIDIVVMAFNADVATTIVKVVVDVPPAGGGGSSWEVTDWSSLPAGWNGAIALDEHNDWINEVIYTQTAGGIAPDGSEVFTFTATAPPWSSDYVFTVTTTDDAGPPAVEVESTFTITVDGARPTLTSITWTDVGGSTAINAGDTLLFAFSEDMDTSTITALNIDTVLPTSGGHTYGAAGLDLDWTDPVGDSTLKVTLGALTDIVSGDTVNPTDAVTDPAGNKDATVPTGVPPTLPTIKDNVKPFLDTIDWGDVDFSTAINAGDTLLFTFSEDMDTSTVTVGTLGSRLPLSIGSYGDGPTVSWAIDDSKSLTVTLGAGTNIPAGGATVNPDPLVTDAVGNPDLTPDTGPTIIDDAGPILRSVTWNDLDSSEDINPGDTLTFVFSEKMDTTTITNANIDARLLNSEAHTYGALEADDLSWNDADTILTVTLGTGTNILVSETVDPTAAVTDVAANADATLDGGPAIVQVTVSLDAPAIVLPRTAFAVPVRITEITDLDAASYDVLFDSTVLELTSVDAGTIDSTTIPVVFTSNLYDEADLLQVDLLGVRIVQNVYDSPGVSGSGTLAVLNFSFIGNSGESSTITLDNGVLSDKEVNEIWANWFPDSVAATLLVGDANGDGVLTCLDITNIERIVSGDPNYPVTPGANANGDFLDGEVPRVDALDITAIELLVAGV